MVDYPLITLAALRTDTSIRVAISGLCNFPFRSSSMEMELNNKSATLEDRIERAVRYIPAPVLEDIRGSREYRVFVLQNTLYDALTYLEGVSS
ncbi:hypothetical protein GCM10020331_100740 [Ectobacillus funiculus]